MSTLDMLKAILDEEDLGEGIELTPETTFEELDLDSLDYVDLTMSCEEEFGIEMDLEPNEMPKTVGELIEKIEELQANK